METFSALLALCAGNSPRSPVNSPHKGQWRGALMFSLICAWINGWVNNREAGDLRRHRADYDVIVMGIGALISYIHKNSGMWLLLHVLISKVVCRADSRFAPSQWETALLCNDVSHWLGASLDQPWFVKTANKCWYGWVITSHWSVYYLCHNWT